MAALNAPQWSSEYLMETLYDRGIELLPYEVQSWFSVLPELTASTWYPRSKLVPDSRGTMKHSGTGFEVQSLRAI